MRDKFAKRLIERRERARLTKAELARRLDEKPSQITNWEKARYLPKADKLPKLSQILNTSIDYLMGEADVPDRSESGDDDALSCLRRSRSLLESALVLIAESEEQIKPETHRVPGRRLQLLLARIPAGTPQNVEEHVEGWVTAPENWLRPKDVAFAVRVSGDSMSPTLEDGDLVVVQRGETAHEGDIVAAVVDGSVTVKRYEMRRGKPVLQPEATNYSPIPVDENVRINGKVVGVLRQIKKRR